MKLNSAVFLDRDGTIIEDRGYLKNPSDVIFFPDTFTALKMLQKNFMLFIITNQSGISKGITTLEEVDAVNKSIIEILRDNEIQIQELYCCPHQTSDNCTCKKPSPYFVRQAALDYNLDMGNSFITGDHPSDVECGIKAGIHPVYLLTGHGTKHLPEIQGDIKICSGIYEAALYMCHNKTTI